MILVLRYMKEQWFLLGLLGVAALTLMDIGGVTAAGKWLKGHYGPDAVIALIFFMSGLVLKKDEIRAGLGDVKGTLAALSNIILIAPLAAAALSLFAPDPGLGIGLILTAVMPTTLTSGVVMTGAAGGNMAHALLITLLSNSLGVVTVPVSLSILLGLGSELQTIPFDRAGLMIQIASIVLVPLFLGMVLRPRGASWRARLSRIAPITNQSLVLAILWMAFSQARPSILGGGTQIATALLLSFVYHALLVAAAFVLASAAGLGAGRRESVVFMGGQKTLTLSVLIQTTLFPQYGLALAFCVVHHFVHLVMDGYLVSWFRKRAAKDRRLAGG